MSFLYHVTNKANLANIRAAGLAPAAKRKASAAQAFGATQKNRIQMREHNRLARFKMFLKELAVAGYSPRTILFNERAATARVQIAFSNKDFAVVDDIPYVEQVGVYPPIPAKKGIVAADADLKEILARYVEKLRSASAPLDEDLIDERQAKAHRAKNSFYGKAVQEIDRLDLSLHHQHFLSELAYAYEELVADDEQEVTRHRVYLFPEKHLKSQYSTYATHIVSGQYENLAILRVDLANVSNPMFDAAQGNGATTKEIIQAIHINYVVGVPLASVQDGSVFNGQWNELSQYV